MKGLVKITKSQTKLPAGLPIPAGGEKRVFIPAFGKDNIGYYYLIDYKENTITCWTINNEKIKTILKKKMNITWDDDSNYFFNNFLAAHSAHFYEDKIYVTSLCSNYIVVLNLKDDGYDVIINEDQFDYVYSATNDIQNGEMYFARWSLSDMVKIFKNVFSTIIVEVGKVNLSTRRFTLFNSFTCGNTIHQASITPDGKKIVLLGMSTATVGEFPNTSKVDPNVDMQELLEQGLLKSQITMYNMETNQFTTVYLKTGTGHIEYDAASDLCYISNHNLGYDHINKNIYCFGPGEIVKTKFSKDKILFLDSYEAPDFIRIPSHKVFTYDNDTYIAASVYPNKVHVLRARDMSIYKKAVVLHNREFTDFAHGPQIYPKIDRTPYTIHPINQSHFIHLVNVWNIRLFDFMSDKVIHTINYNFNRKSLITIGHGLDF